MIQFDLNIFRLDYVTITTCRFSVWKKTRWRERRIRFLSSSQSRGRRTWALLQDAVFGDEHLGNVLRLLVFVVGGLSKNQGQKHHGLIICCFTSFFWRNSYRATKSLSERRYSATVAEKRQPGGFKGKLDGPKVLPWIGKFDSLGMLGAQKPSSIDWWHLSLNCPWICEDGSFFWHVR